MNKLSLFGSLLSLFLVGQAFGQIPNELYYDRFYGQDGNIDLVIRIYTNATTGAYLYEDSNTVTVVDGAFSTSIGDNTTYGSLSNALVSGNAYLDITINGANLPPREQILPEAYALKAASVLDNAITASMITSNAIQTRHIASGAVEADLLAAGAVTSDKLAADVWTANDNRYASSNRLFAVETNYVRRTGETMSGSLTNQGTVTAARFFKSGNTATGNQAFAIAGNGNTAGGASSAIGGGVGNQAHGTVSVVAGGSGNKALANYSAVGGGSGNQAQGLYSFVGGGVNNIATDSYATVIGGRDNKAGAYGAMVPGGYNNAATGMYSFAAGYMAYAAHAGAFVWADSSEAAFFNSAGIDTFNVRARGGIMMAGPMTVQSNLAVNGYATILRVVKQGDISMGTFTNGP